MTYSSSEIFIREIGAGIWFGTSFWLAVTFLSYVCRETSTTRRDSVLVAVAVFLSLFFLGSSIRGFLTWMQFFYLGNGWDPSMWIQLWPWYGMSVILNIIGATGSIWMLSSWHWRVIFTSTAIGGAIVLPFLLRFMV